MHMADALTSPAVGGALWVASGVAIACSTRRLRNDLDEYKVPLMGVLGAFVFSAQMVNFSIPGTGSSGHFGGGLLLAILLGPHAAFLTIVSVLAVQALFFADGGLLALGCNIFNIGFLPCFLAYPLIYRRLMGTVPTARRLFTVTMLTAILSLQLGAFAVVIETTLSGITELPFQTFSLLMLPIHLAIGIVEGLITSAVIAMLQKARPDMIDKTWTSKPTPAVSFKKVLAGLACVTLIIAGILSGFASASPDGLEWAISHATGQDALQAPPSSTYATLEHVQAKMAIMPDYAFTKNNAISEQTSPTPRIDTSIAGLVGATLTLGLVALLGVILKRRRAST